MEVLIDVKNIGKYFGPIKAVDGVSFQVARGEVLGFLGPNGAGKTTTMRLLTCFLAPTFGTAIVGGHDIIENSIAVRQKVGYLAENAPAYGEMRVIDFLKFIAAIRGFRGRVQKDKISEMIEQVSLQSVLGQSIETLSKGYKRRVGLAQALLHNPEVLILDEPTDGLDPNQKHQVRQLIKNIAADKAIVVSTHILEEVDAVCSRMIIINKGKIAVDSTPDKLREESASHGVVTLGLRTSGQEQELEVLKKVPSVRKVELLVSGTTRRFVVYPQVGAEVAHNVAKTAHEQGWIVEEFSVAKGRLDEVFRRITIGENK